MARGQQRTADLVAIDGGGRPEPPAGMAEEQAQIWRDTVGSHPADWFAPSCYPLLEQWCGTVAMARVWNRVLAAEGAKPEPDFAKLLQMQGAADRASRTLLQIGTKLRITPQSLTNHRGNARKGSSVGPRPWDVS